MIILPLYTYADTTLTLWLPRHARFSLEPELSYYRDDPQGQAFRGARYVIEQAPSQVCLTILDQTYRLVNAGSWN
jgi:hypothetical protein